MGGDKNQCPIVENQCLQLRFGTGEVLVSASCDTIQMFPDPQYTHLRLYDQIRGSLRMIFLDDDIMSELVGFGIPVTIRESITQAEHESWMNYMGQIAVASMDIELDELLGGE